MSISPEYARAPPRVVLRPTAAGVLEVRDEDDDRIRLIISREEEEEDCYADCCKTPTTKEFRLPEVAASCPPAPRKRARAARCRRRLSELEFLVVRQEEMEGLFTRRGDGIVSLKKQKKRNVDS